jgi:SAM-dependent methyltransferase
VSSDPWDYADLYERWSSNYREDLSFYRAAGERALRHGGPILELCCGTGRLLPVLQASGASVVGLDISADQLRLAAAKAELRVSLDEGRLHLLQGDMAAFRLAQHFSLVVVAFNSLCYLLDDITRARCLHTIAEHLLPGGELVLDVDNPITNHAGPEGAFALDDLLLDYPVQGDATRIYIGHDRHNEDPRIENVHYRFVVTTEHGELIREVHHDMRCKAPAEVMDEIESAGLSIKRTSGSFSGKQFDALKSPLLIVAAQKKS